MPSTKIMPLLTVLGKVLSEPAWVIRSSEPAFVKSKLLTEDQFLHWINKPAETQPLVKSGADEVRRFWRRTLEPAEKSDSSKPDDSAAYFASKRIGSPDRLDAPPLPAAQSLPHRDFPNRKIQTINSTPRPTAYPNRRRWQRRQGRNGTQLSEDTPQIPSTTPRPPLVSSAPRAAPVNGNSISAQNGSRRPYNLPEEQSGITNILIDSEPSYLVDDSAGSSVDSQFPTSVVENEEPFETSEEIEAITDTTEGSTFESSTVFYDSTDGDSLLLASTENPLDSTDESSTEAVVASTVLEISGETSSETGISESTIEATMEYTFDSTVYSTSEHPFVDTSTEWMSSNVAFQELSTEASVLELTTENPRSESTFQDVTSELTEQSVSDYVLLSTTEDAWIGDTTLGDSTTTENTITEVDEEADLTSSTHSESSPGGFFTDEHSSTEITEAENTSTAPDRELLSTEATSTGEFLSEIQSFSSAESTTVESSFLAIDESSEFGDFIATEMFSTETTEAGLYEVEEVYYTEFVAATGKINAKEALRHIPQKTVKTKMPLEALLDEPDLQFLARSVKGNVNFPTLSKIGLTMFAPVDASFDNLPIDMEMIDPQTINTKQDANDIPSVPPRAKLLRRLLATLKKRKREMDPADKTPLEEALIAARGPHSSRVEGFAAANEELLANEFLINPPEFEQAFRQIHVSEGAERKDVLKDFEQLIMYHVVKKIVPPGMIVAKGETIQKTEAKKPLTIRLEWIGDEPIISVGGQARVLEIISCKQGYIYKVDQPIFPPWNDDAPTILHYIKSVPQFSKLAFLVSESGIFDAMEFSGPITMLLIPDHAWRVYGIKMPDCFFRMLVKEQNRAIMDKILKWIIIPGIWHREDILRTSWLPNAMPPSLVVSNINMKLWHEIAAKRQKVFEATRHNSTNTEVYDLNTGRLRNPEAPINLPGGFDLRTAPEPLPNDTSAMYKGVVTLIEGKQVVDWDIPLYNGVAHTLDELPLRPDLDLTTAIWECLDELCFECPIVTPFVLSYFDSGGLLPDPINPKGYIVPPGIRPKWMCSTYRNWFPPGWELSEWNAYINAAKKGNVKSAEKMAIHGYTKAAHRLSKLQDMLEEASVNLGRINAFYGDWSNQVLPAEEDPNDRLGRMVYRRNIGYKPKICESFPRKHVALSLYGMDEEADTDGWGVLGYRDAYDEALRMDYMKEMSMQDFQYVTQWM